MSPGQRRQDRRHAEGPVVGSTGARFGGANVRRLRKAASPPGEAPVVPTLGPPRDDVLVVGQTGARFASRTWADTDQQAGGDSAEQTLVPETEALTAESVDETDWVVDETDWAGSEENYDLVRPYARTGGRTVSRKDLAIEALISATGRPLSAGASPEHHAILRLCGAPRSVAELAALLSVPLGVARVVLGDMAEAGSVAVHRTAAGIADGAPDLALMQRVLACLQRL
jgi:hypothetical protein